jgi:two-component system cell cycle sensor histidine kinase/response regulator CckA
MADQSGPVGLASPSDLGSPEAMAERERESLCARLERAEEALRDAEQRYQRLAEATTDYIYTAKVAEGRVVATRHGPGCIAVTGYSSEEFAADPFLWYRMIVPEDRPAVEAQAERILGGETKAIEHRITRKDGLVRSVRNTPVLERDAGGKLVGYDGLVQDVTARREAEEALRESEQKYRQIFDAGGDAVFVHELRLDGNPGQFLEVNDTACWQLGYSREELLAMAAAEINAPWSMAEITPILAKYAAGHSATFERVHVARDGREIPVEIHARPFVFRGRPAVIALVRDISERKQTERALRFAQYALDHTADAGFWIDRTGRFFYVNQAACDSLGFTRDEFLEMSVPDIAPDLPWEAWPERWTKLSEGPGLVYESRHRAKDGEVFPVEISANAVAFEGELYVCGFARDITARKQAEAERARLQAQLVQAQKMEAVGRLAGGVAHDFNNLLTAILGFSELALLDLDPGTEAAQNLFGIRHIVQQSQALTRQILAFSRQQVLTTAIVDINAEVRSACKLLRRVIGEDITVETVLDPDLGRVRADGAQLQQILLNLAVNSRDAMPQGGKLTITTTNVTLSEEALRAVPEARPGDYVRLTVSDTGSGMDSGTLGRIFEPFFTTKQAGRGTGFGLATVYGIVRQHHGHVEVESAPGTGTVFQVYLPQAEAESDAQLGHSSAPDAPHGNETILVVEDDPSVREVTCRRLEAYGYRVLSAAGPSEAISLAGAYRDHIAILLTDIVMPGMDGRELHARLYAERPGLGVLYMSGYTGDVLAGRGGALDEGVRLIHKPFGIAELTHQIRAILDDSP